MNVEIGAEAALFPEKEYIKGIFVTVQTRVFVWFSSLIFPFYKMILINRLEFSGFVDFL